MGHNKMPILMTVAVFMLGNGITNLAEAQETPTCAQKLVPCAHYVNSTSPPSSCCDPLKEAVQTQLQCLCNLYNTPGFLKSFGVTFEGALRLSKACGISPDTTKCSNATDTAPAPAPYPTSGQPTDHIKRKTRFTEKQRVGIIASSVVLATGMTILGLVFCIRKKILGKQGIRKAGQRKDYINEEENEDLELPKFDLPTIANATDNFSPNNKLGQGGFGPVYKGTLKEGQEIAVKRLSKSSGQGLKEFKNEVILIAKLQHRNLVKLLGYCIQGDEKMLIYEFMPNKSLDFFIFDQTRNKLINWHKRINIIGGIARGLLYLHQDSRLRIIHRDLKTSNILLDKDMDPKISDFGLARTFLGDQTEENTNRVVGTYGYMSPEYSIDGLFSIKSDVFSFGVLVLEIVSGRKNRGFYHQDHNLNLLGHAWRLWIEEKPLELLDTVLSDSFSLSEVLRCIHVGLLCVQQQPKDRPNMSSVVLMLGSDGVLPSPKQPGFYTERNPQPVAHSSPNKNESCSTNKVSITVLEAR